MFLCLGARSFTTLPSIVIVPELSLAKIEKALYSFLGRSFQTPPMYSAKKVNGQRLYKLARKNIEVKREPVEIQIKHISLDHFTQSTITFSVICSKGTYIRTLGKEIAEKLETVGYLTSLIRTQVGGYSIDESQSIQEFEASWKSSAN